MSKKSIRFNRSSAVVFLLIIGLALWGWGLYVSYKSFASFNWHATDGRVTVSKIDQEAGRKQKQRPVIEYEYVVDGETFTSKNVQFDTMNLTSTIFSKFGTNHLLEKYPEGQVVEVIYNPDDPNESVLETQLPFSAYAVMILATLACTCAVVPMFASEFKPDYIAMRAENNEHSENSDPKPTNEADENPDD